MGTRRGSGRPPSGIGPERVEEWPDGDWVVRQVSATAATKAYRCPGCDQEVRAGTSHVVAWPASASAWGTGYGVEDRRHWHPGCWHGRLRRGPGVRRPPQSPRR